MALSPTGRNRNRNRVTPAAREANGRHQREPKRLSEAAQAAANRAVVLAQPHRRGRLDDRRRWPIGRMILDGKVAWPELDPDSLHRAAERYHDAYASLRWVMDSRRPYANGIGGRSRAPTPDERAAIEREWGDIRRVLRDCPSGPRVTKAMDLAILDAHPDADYRVFNSFIPRSCAEGLAALVHHWGLAT